MNKVWLEQEKQCKTKWLISYYDKKVSSCPYSIQFYFNILTLTSEMEKSGQVKKSEVPKSATNKNVFEKREICGDFSCMNEQCSDNIKTKIKPCTRETSNKLRTLPGC